MTCTRYVSGRVRGGAATDAAGRERRVRAHERAGHGLAVGRADLSPELRPRVEGDVERAVAVESKGRRRHTDEGVVVPLRDQPHVVGRDDPDVVAARLAEREVRAVLLRSLAGPGQRRGKRPQADLRVLDRPVRTADDAGQQDPLDEHDVDARFVLGAGVHDIGLFASQTAAGPLGHELASGRTGHVELVDV